MRRKLDILQDVLGWLVTILAIFLVAGYYLGAAPWYILPASILEISMMIAYLIILIFQLGILDKMD